MAETNLQKPLPAINSEANPFWDGAANHKLMMQRCLDCTAYIWTPRPSCFECGSENIQRRDLALRHEARRQIGIARCGDEPGEQLGCLHGDSSGVQKIRNGNASEGIRVLMQCLPAATHHPAHFQRLAYRHRTASGKGVKRQCRPSYDVAVIT